ncbi:transcriptional regulator [Desulfosporosinus orientis DSM 765]|uniref:Transcriptional regulator n=1 Tax=Desulfosporosinus orientis (strain ATCC 19365 / DSM 765 / NCIMB 8382 / VKM B-1628 / Singapore I) TaxID=768706 RepID=G7WFA0_DESOD|nr:TetR/AcrR family transcriptional regulator C-terminal domain-containing protein [Desulfosporosinus orientis]AET67986.1 transcriptional regulator [Desulfosporosinus orientis DSM 765]
MSTKKSNEKKQSKNKSREPLNIEKIVQTALELLNEVGLQQLTTRRLAEALGIRSASLYWHIRDKAELLQLLSESICSKLHLPDPGLSWQDQVLSFAMQYRATLLSIRDSAVVLLETPPLTPKRLLLSGAMFEVLFNAGFPPKEILMASMLINDYMLSFVKNEMHMSQMAQSQGISAQEVMNNAKIFFSNLPPDQYPTLISLADYMTYDIDEHYNYGLQILLDSFKKRLQE